MRYRKKPVVVEAFRLGFDIIPGWFMDKVLEKKIVLHGDERDKTNADIKTLEGWMHASYGDYVILGITGEVYPCKPDIFEKTYEKEN